MENKILTSLVILPPKFLDTNLENHIQEQLSMRKCNKENGYILLINEVLDYTENIISRIFSNVEFKVKYQATVFKPEVGMKLKLKVIGIYPQGVFLEYNKLKIFFIPHTFLKDYTYDKVGKKYEKEVKKGKKKERSEINENGEYLVELSSVNFEGKDFKCLCKLI